MPVAGNELLMSRTGPVPQPARDDRLVEMDEQTLSELLDSGKPVRIPCEWRSMDGKVDVLDVSISCCGRGLETGETVQAGHFSQSMNYD